MHHDQNRGKQKHVNEAAKGPSIKYVTLEGMEGV